MMPSPEHLLRIAGLLFDILDYCKNDENFRIKKTVAGSGHST